MIDVLALMGDTIDNVQGVPGIGEKGARDLIATFGSLDEPAGARRRGPAEEISRRPADACRRGATEPRAGEDSHRRRGAFDPEVVPLPRRLARALLCAVLAARVPDARHRVRANRSSIAKDYAAVTTAEELDVLVGELRDAGRFALRIVADGPSCVRATLIGLVFSTAPRHARYVPLGHEGFAGGSVARSSRPRWTLLRPVLEDPAIEKVGHDLKADLVVLARHGIALAGLDFDTMLASYLIDATKSSQDLEPTVLEQLGYKALTQDEVCGKGVKALPFAQVPVDGILDFAGERADLALQLAGAPRADAGRAGARAGLPRPRAAAGPDSRRPRAHRHPRRRRARWRRRRRWSTGS